jgi:predicted ATP-dependent endonuclease of OLD family
MKIRHLEIRNFRGIKSLSWHVRGDFNCIIGAGDACKTTVLTALDYALSPRITLTLDDADFFNQDVTQDIVIQVTLAEWNESEPETRGVFSRKQVCAIQMRSHRSRPYTRATAQRGRSHFLCHYGLTRASSQSGQSLKGATKARNRNKKPIYAG